MGSTFRAIGQSPTRNALVSEIRRDRSIRPSSNNRSPPARALDKAFARNRRTRESQRADLCILNLGDTSTETGRLMFTLIGAIACFERELMLERQREGIAKAKEEGKYKGRKPTARARAAEIATLKADGVRPTDIARQLGIGRASVYRILESRPS